MLIDTHAHINGPEFSEDLSDVLKRASENGVGRIVCVGYDIPTSRKALALAEQDPTLFATVGLHPNFVSERRREGVLRRVERLLEVGVDHHALALEASPALARAAGAVLGLADRPAAVAGAEGELPPPRVVLAEQNGAAVALAQRAGLDQLERVLRQLEQPHQVRDRRAAPADPAAHLAARQAEVVNEHGAGARLLDRVQVLPGHVLRQGQVEALPVVRLPDKRRDRLELRDPGGPEPALPRHELVLPTGERPEDDRLKDAA